MDNKLYNLSEIDESKDYSVKVEHLTKIYKKYKRPWYRVINAFSSKVPYKKFYAMKDVSVTIPRGESVGIIGKNGNGKSTLLKMITGVTKMTSGTIDTNGRIVAMLELTSGFDKELTGRQNAYIKGRTIGLSKDEITSRMDDILAFADIGDFIDQPVRTYSSGMKSRLGFAVSVNLDPDILIVDEVLAVGDTSFKLKCLAKMEEFRKQGKTILFVSHDLNTIKAFCSSCMWIKEGEIVDYGQTGVIVQAYQDYLKAERRAENERRRKENADLLLTKDDMLHPEKAFICNSDGEKQNVFMLGDNIEISANYEVNVPADMLTCAITVLDSEQKEIFASDRQGEKFIINNELGRHRLHVTLHSPKLLPGHYFLTCEIWNPQSGFVRAVINKKPFEMQSEFFKGTGLLAIECTCSSK